jgi:hypothetical protein
MYKPGHVALASPQGTSLAERQGRQRPTRRKHIVSARRQRGRLVITFPDAVDEALEICSSVRKMTPEDMASRILGDVVMRGSIVEALRDFADFQTDQREANRKARASINHKRAAAKSAAKNGAC